MPSTRWRDALHWRLDVPLALAGGLALAAVLTTLTWPFGMDQGIFASIGDLILEGAVPYRDAWDTKGPLAFYPYAMAQALFGANTWAIRLLDAAFLLAGAVVLGRVVAHLASWRAGAWSAVGLLLFTLRLGHSETAQPDGWVGTLALLAFAPLLTAGDAAPSARQLVRVGIGVGLAALVKPFYLLLALVPLAMLSRDDWCAWRRALACIAWLALGVLLPVALMAAVLAAQGGLGDYLQVHVQYTATAYAGVAGAGGGGRLRGLLEYLTRWPGHAAVVPFVVAGGAALARDAGGPGRAVVAWTTVVFALVVLQGRFYFYHWLPTIAPSAVCAGVALHRAWLAVPARGAAVSRLVVAGVLALLGVVVAPAPARAVMGALAFALQRKSYAQHLESFRHSRPLDSPAINHEVAGYLRANTAPGDRITVWGWNASLHFFSGRAAPSRFLFHMPLVAVPSSPFTAGYRREFLDAHRRMPPRYVVLGAPYDETVPDELAAFPEFAAIVRRDYALDRTIRGVALYRRRTAGIATP